MTRMRSRDMSSPFLKGEKKQSQRNTTGVDRDGPSLLERGLGDAIFRVRGVVPGERPLLAGSTPVGETRPATRRARTRAKRRAAGSWTRFRPSAADRQGEVTFAKKRSAVRPDAARGTGVEGPFAHGRELSPAIRPLRAAQTPRPGGHGRALPGGARRKGAGKALCRQDRPAAPGGQGLRPALPRRGQRRRPAVARKPGHGVRRRTGRGRDLHRHGLRRGQGPAGGLEPLRPAGRGLPHRHRRPHRQGDGARAGLRPRLQGPAPGPPGYLAAQRACLLQR